METETQTDPGAELRSLGAQVDAGEDPDLSSWSEEPQESQSAAVEKKTPEPEAEAKVKAPAETEQKSEAKSVDTSPEKAAEEKQSPYQKEKSRQAKAWQEIQETKDEVRRQLAELKEAKQTQFRDEAGYTAQDYEGAAQKAWTEAQEARVALDDDKAKEAEGFVQQFQQLAQQARQKEFHAARQSVAQQMVNEIPELGDPKSPLRIATDELLKGNEVLRMHPDGLKLAPQMAKAQMAAGEVPALKAKIEELTKENERLVKLTSVGGSGPAKRGGESNGNLTAADLRRMAEAHDSQAA